jgi:hypothetical protein
MRVFSRWRACVTVRPLFRAGAWTAFRIEQVDAGLANRLTGPLRELAR